MPNVTPGDWNVEPNGDQFGHYVLGVAQREQETWVNEGYDVSDEEGDRRQEVANAHDEANAKLLSAAPALFAALERAVQAAERHNNGGSLDYDWIGEAQAALDAVKGDASEP